MMTPNAGTSPTFVRGTTIKTANAWIANTKRGRRMTN